MIVIHEEDSRPIKAWVGLKPEVPGFAPNGLFADNRLPDIEDRALQQLKNLAKLPFIHKNGVAAMPDVHAGIGATVGSVIATRGAVIPAAVGVDIGCGMNAVQTSFKAKDLPDSLTQLRHDIERGIPLGSGGAHSKVTDEHYHALPIVPSRLTETWHTITGTDATHRAVAQLGTLGSGNHFIELCLDEHQNVWVMLHSGSRGIGNKIGRYYIEQAKRDMERFWISLPDQDLAYLPEGSKNFDDYIEAVNWAQEYALVNRQRMMATVLRALRHTLGDYAVHGEAINCHHNYVTRENHFGENLFVTRKGAVNARQGVMGIIPGSMGQRSYIVRGKGHPESYCSCSHGAGRQMSRTEARRRFTVADLEAQTQGVECRKDDAVLDEIPSSYKDIDEVMANQADLVEIVHTLKQVMCIKGA